MQLCNHCQARNLVPFSEKIQCLLDCSEIVDIGETENKMFCVEIVFIYPTRNWVEKKLSMKLSIGVSICQTKDKTLERYG